MVVAVHGDICYFVFCDSIQCFVVKGYFGLLINIKSKPLIE